MKKRFGLFFSDNYGRIFSFFTNRILDHEESKDLAQETFLRAFRALKNDPSLDLAFPWLFTIANNVLKNWYRYHTSVSRRGRAVAFEESSDGTDGTTMDPTAKNPDEILVNTESLRMVRKLVSEMPPKMRQCFLLRYFHDIGHREIAALLDITESAVRSQVSQARTRINQNLDPPP